MAPPAPGGTAAAMSRTWQRYSEFLGRPPESVFEWNDPETSARGWLVVNGLKGGAAGGGTRMRRGLTREEVEYLAKVMELKFSVSGPPIGGAKSGIDFDPAHPRKREVLARWFEAIRPLLESRISTAGDLNVDEVREVLPLCTEIGLLHPQQGLARGHFGLEGEALAARLDLVRQTLGQPVAEPLGLEKADLQLADLVTGFSVATATARLLEHQGRSLDGVRVLVEGFGRVGGAASLYLSRWGASIVGIVDVRSALVAEDGLSTDEVEDLLCRRGGNELPVDLPGRAVGPRQDFERAAADLYVCAAASETLDAEGLDRLAGQGVRTIVSGANRPFAAAYHGDISVERDADGRFGVIADFIGNCGTAHAFAYSMQQNNVGAAAEIFDSVEMTVCGALDEAAAIAGNAERGLLAAAIDAALDRCFEG